MKLHVREAVGQNCVQAGYTTRLVVDESFECKKKSQQAPHTFLFFFFLMWRQWQKVVNTTGEKNTRVNMLHAGALTVTPDCSGA